MSELIVSRFYVRLKVAASVSLPVVNSIIMTVVNNLTHCYDYGSTGEELYIDTRFWVEGVTQVSFPSHIFKHIFSH